MTGPMPLHPGLGHNGDRQTRAAHWSILLAASPLLAVIIWYTDEAGSPLSELFSFTGLMVVMLYSWGPLLGLFIMAYALAGRVQNVVIKHVLTLVLGIALGAAIELAFFMIVPRIVQAVLR